jgi:hypothetical protein
MAEKGRGLTWGLAWVGAVLAWLPLVATLITGLAGTVISRRLRVDYLMPAELFPLALVGSGLLLWAALRARRSLGARPWRTLAGALGIAVAALFGSQGVAMVTGLASGRTEPTGWRMALVLALLAVYTLALVALAVAGVRLARALTVGR